MTIDEFRGIYHRIAILSQDHPVYLVQENSTGKLFVEKQLTVYSSSVYRYLLAHPVPDTPRLYALIEEADRLTILEEYLSGTSLSQLLRQQGTMQEAQVLDLGLQLCTIVEALHSAVPPIIHRDIKPDNLLLSPDGRLKLLDMNAAKWHQAHETRDTRLIGTTGYAAPEQYGFGASGPETDLYAIGVVLNELLTGSLPGETLATGRLRPIIARCCRLDPKDRYPSVPQLKAALEALSSPGAKGSYLPPGFRSKRPLSCLLSGLGYMLLLAIGLGITPSSCVNTLALWLDRILFTSSLLLIVLFSGNYRGLQSQLPLSRSRQPLLRLFGVLLWDTVLLFSGPLLAVILESLLF